MTATAVRKRQPRMPIEARREQALDAALELIVEGGYGAVNMESVARRVGVAKPVIYNAYPGVDALLSALLNREQARALSALFAATPPDLAGADPKQRLIFWLSSIAAEIVRSPDAWRLILASAESAPPEMQRRIAKGRALALAQLRGVAATLLARHPRLSEADLDLAAGALMAVAESGGRALGADPRRETADRLVRFVSDLMLVDGK